MTESTAKLAEALASFQAEMPVVHKGKKANVPLKAGGSYSYTYADLSDVTEAAAPVMVKHGLSFACTPRVVDGGGYELAGTLLHVSGESITGALPLHGRTMQEIGSALTYARRYLLGCLTGIVTDDDDDGQAANTAKPTMRPEKPMTQRTQGHLFALFAQKGIPDEKQLAGINQITGADYTSRGQVTEKHAQEVIGVLQNRPDARPEAEVAELDKGADQ